jgi:DNA-binding transcriptional ArsR family regulator
VRALSHPLRVRILAILEERTASPLDLSRILRAKLGVVAYHVRTLHRLGLIELEREVPVRGALQRFYRARERPTISAAAWAKAPPVAKQALIGATIQQISDFAQGSNAAGGFDRTNSHITRTSLKLDAEGFERLADVLMGVLSEVDKIEAEVAERHRNGEDDLEPVGLVMMLFEALPFSAGVSPALEDPEHELPARPRERSELDT